MADPVDLVDRLRNSNGMEAFFGDLAIPLRGGVPLIAEAADEIERLRSECERFADALDASYDANEWCGLCAADRKGADHDMIVVEGHIGHHVSCVIIAAEKWLAENERRNQ